jgi:photosystem II stability/assembly factor-like uncharacterized protein
MLLGGRVPVWGDIWTQTGPEGGVIDVVLAHPVDPSTVYAASDGAGVFKSTSAGARWRAVNGGLGNLNVRVLAVSPLESDVLYAGTRGGGVFESIDGGESWQPINRGLSNRDVRSLAVDATNRARLYAATARGVFRSDDGGANWALWSDGLGGRAVRVLAVDPFVPSTLYAGADTGGLFKSVDGAATWKAAGEGVDSTLFVALSFDAWSPSTLYAGTGDGALLRSDNRGASWFIIKDALAGDRVNALAIDPNVRGAIYVATTRGTFKSDDAGASWRRAEVGLGDGVVLGLSVLPRAPGTLYAAGSGGIFRSANRAESWSASHRELIATTVSALAIDPTEPATLYAGAFRAHRTTTEGMTWQTVAAGLGQGFVFALAVDPRAPATVYAGGGVGVFKSTDRGQSWMPANQGLANRFVFALVADPSVAETLYAGTGGGVFESRDGARSWRSAGLAGSDVRALSVVPGSPRAVYAGTESGGVFKTTNGGDTWLAVGAGLPGAGIAALSVHPADPRTVYAGTRGAGLFKSADGGASWSEMNGGLGNRTVLALAVEPSDARRVYAGTAQGVFRSTNGGASWLPYSEGLTRTYVLSLLAHPTVPGKLFAGTFGGGVFRVEQTLGPDDSPATLTVEKTAAVPGQTVPIRVLLAARDAASGTAALDLLFNGDVFEVDASRCARPERLDRHALVVTFPEDQPAFPFKRLRLLLLDIAPPIDPLGTGEIGRCDFRVFVGAPPGTYSLRVERSQVVRTDGAVLCGVGSIVDCAAEHGAVVVVEAPPTPTAAPSSTPTIPPPDSPTVAEPEATPTPPEPSATPGPVCGNGTIEDGEECDSGGVASACCSTDCLFLDGGDCDDGDPCTTGDSCAAGECRGGAVETCVDGDGCCPRDCAWTADADCRRVEFEPRSLPMNESVSGPMVGGRFDSDDADDLLLGDASQPRLVLLRGDGRGGVSGGAPFALEAGAGAGRDVPDTDEPFGMTDLAAADIDGDGLLDLVAGLGDGAIVAIFGDGLGNFTFGPKTEIGSVPRRVLVGDLIRGGTPDAVVATDQGVLVLSGTGSGHFAPAGHLMKGSPVGAVALADLNADGRLDLVIALEAENQVRFLFGNGEGGFEAGPVISVGAPSALVVGDFTSDEWPDLVVASRVGRSLAVHAGEIGGVSSQPLSVFAAGEIDDMVRADLNGDGLADIAALDRSAGVLRVLAGRGDGTFAADAMAPSEVMAGPDAHAFATLDLNGDGLPDFAVSAPRMLLATAVPSGDPPRPGDANGDRSVDSRDLEDNTTELFDGDGVDAQSCGGGAAACTMGADANRDGRISAADLIATLRLPTFLTSRAAAN